MLLCHHTLIKVSSAIVNKSSVYTYEVKQPEEFIKYTFKIYNVLSRWRYVKDDLK